MDPVGSGMPAGMFSGDPQQMSNMVRQMRSNPTVQVMLNNPELLREALHNNPAIRQVLRQTCGIGSHLSTPLRNR